MKLRHVRPARLVIKLLSLIQNHLWLFFFSLILALFSILGVVGYRFLVRHNVNPQELLSFFGSPLESLNSTNGITNFLILGIRGEGGDSPNLSDTIMVVSYDHTQKTPSIISIPRDLWVPSLKAKINTAYHYGEEASPGAGIKLAQAAILEDLGLPINYTAVINFTLFEQAIDLVGGVDVNVIPGFTDTEFPIPGREKSLPISSRYESISFPQGLNHFNGATALKFVRSRHAEGEEGTDFSRSRRQQQVISSLRQKIFNLAFLLDQKNVDSLLNIIGANLITNIPSRLYPTLAKLALDSKDSPVKSVPLSITPDENGVTILYNPPKFKFGGKWVLIPKDNNWNALKQYLKNHLNISK